MSDPPLEIAVAIEDERWVALDPDPGRLVEPFIRAAVAAAGPAGAAEVSLVLADDVTVHQLNRQYRGQDKPTNVLSFAFADAPGPAGAAGAPLLLGDVVVAYETVMREAAAAGQRPQDHLCHLVVHGVLHLLGYDHATEADAASMERLETRILAGLGLPDPYAGDEAA